MPVWRKENIVNRDVMIGACFSLAALFTLPDVAAAQSTRPSAVTCEHYARSYAQQASTQGQMLGGAARGSLLGLGIGAIAGAAGTGAAIGASIGAIGGGARRESAFQSIYNAAYQDCMAGRIR